MTFGAGLLGLYGTWSRPELRRQLPGPVEAATGIATAGGLYLIFQVGDRLSRLILPSGEREIEEIYRLRTLAPKPLIALALATVIGPSEELFWRGLIQHAFTRRFGTAGGLALGAAAYGGTHLVTRNLTLTGAASVAGAYWGLEYAVQPTIAPLLVSHILWDLWIFLVAPTPTGKRR